MKINKKATEFGMAFLAVIVVVIVFMSASYSLYSKINGISKTLGDTQYKLINTYDNAEKINFYIDEAAKRSANSALYDLAKNGGLANQDCSEYFGSSLLVNQEYDCMPKQESDITNEYLNMFNKEFKVYLSNYPYANVNSEYDLNYYEGLLVGISQNKISLPITSKIIEELKKSNETLALQEKIDNLVGNSKVVEIAKSQVGKPYSMKTGAKPEPKNTNPSYFDCAGFTGWVFGTAGASKDFKVPSRAAEQYTNIKKYPELIIYDKDDSTKNSLELYKKALTIPGLLLVQNKAGVSSTSGIAYSGHAALTLGDGKSIIEAGGFSYKYCKDLGTTFLPGSNSCVAITSGAFSKGNPTFYLAAKVPGINYSTTQSQDNNQQIQIQNINNLNSTNKTINTTNQSLNLQSTDSCSNFDTNKIAFTNLKGCYRYNDIFKKYISENNLNIDPLLIMSLVWTESNCMNAEEMRPIKGNDIANRGIMQVDEACGKQGKCPNIDSEIKEGMNIFKQKFDTVSKQASDLSEKDKMILVLYSYNRGDISSVLKYYKQGSNLDEAMKKGCMDNFKVDAPKGTASSRYDSKNVDKCTAYGYGYQYPKKVMDIYQNTCTKMGGNIAQGSIVTYNTSSSSSTYGSIGEYSFTPAFEINMGYDFSVYKKIFDTMLKLNYKYNDLTSDDKNKFMNNIVNEAKTIDSSVDWSMNCESPVEKMYYSFAEQYYLCANSLDNNCYCEMKIYPQVSLENFNFILSSNPPEGNDGSQFLLSGNSNDEIISEALPGFKRDYTLATGIVDGDVKINGKIVNSDLIMNVEIPNSNGYETYDYKNNILTPFFMYKEKINNDMSRLSFIAPYSVLRDGVTRSYYDKVKDNYNNKNLTVCKIQKDTVKLCVNSNKKLLVYDKTKNNISFVDNTIKFAYTFRDILPPLSVYDIIMNNDMFMTDKTIILKWSHENKYNDVLKFKIYYSTEDFDGKSLKEIKNDPNIKTINLDNSNNVILSGVNILNPEFKVENFVLKNYYSSLGFNIESNIVYEFSKDNSDDIITNYASKISFDSNNQYYVLISAYDNKNNEIGIDSQKINYKEIKTKDTLPPATAPLKGFNFDNLGYDQNNKIVINWFTKPLKNIDGSSFDSETELKGYNIYYIEDKDKMDETTFFTLNPVFVDKDQNNVILDVDSSKGWYYYVVPVDINGNMQFNKDTKQYMNNKEFFNPKHIDPKN